MDALVVYESLYGNTAAVGQAIAASLRAHGLQVDVGPVSKLDPSKAAGVQLLVVGGPTHAHGMSRAGTRTTAVHDKANTYAEPTLAPGLREWIGALAPGAGRLAAAFDTRIDKPVLVTGSAARGIARRLERRGCRLVVRPESFLVSTANRLLDGETAHATRWGRQVAQRAQSELAASGAQRRRG